MSSNRRREMVDITDQLRDKDLRSDLLSAVFASAALAGLAASAYFASEVYEHYDSLLSIFTEENGTLAYYLGKSFISSAAAASLSAFTAYCTKNH